MVCMVYMVTWIFASHTVSIKCFNCIWLALISGETHHTIHGENYTQVERLIGELSTVRNKEPKQPKNLLK